MRLTATRTSVTSGGGAIDALYRAAGGKPTLDQRFAKDKLLVDKISGNNLITFSRASTGTYVGSDGLIKTSPVNLLYDTTTYSNWTSAGQTFQTNAAISPFGSNDAVKLVADAVAGGKFSYRTVATTTTNVCSVYAKAGEYTNIRLQDIAASRFYVNFDLSAGNYQLAGGPDFISADIQDAGNGWYRCIVVNSRANIAFAISGYPNSVTVTTGYPNFTGDGTSGVYIWGAQVEANASFPTSYIPTTSTISGAPRFDHDPVTGESLGLLIEESRTNLVTNSRNLADYFTEQHSTATANSGVSPDGTTTATVVTPDATNNRHSSYNLSINFTASTTYSYSIFVKPNGYTFLQLLFTSAFSNANAWVNFNLTGTGSFGFTGGGELDKEIQAYPNGWYKCTVIATSGSSASTAGPVYSILDADRNSRDPNYAGNGTSGAYIWGAQVEAGSFPTSYIPTTGTTVTRAADLARITGTNFSSWYNQSEGTVFIKGSTSDLDANTGWSSFFQASSPSNNRISIRQGTTIITSAGTTVSLANSASPTANETEEIAFAYKENDFAQYTSYANPVFQGTGLTPVSVDTLLIASVEGSGSTFNLNGHISRLAYFSTRKSDQDLIKITDGTLAPAIITYGITSAGGTFNLRSTGTVDYAVDWDSTGGYEESTLNTLPHTYTAGNYSLVVYSDGVYRPYFTNVTADVNQITSVDIGSGADLGTNLDNAWYGARNMTTFTCPFDVTSSVASFIQAWRGCSSLTSFPLLNTSSATSFGSAWRGCSSLTSFPLLNTSSGTDFGTAWFGCSNLTSFPLLDTSSGTTFNIAWRNCTSLTSFPLLNTSSGTNFGGAWQSCTSLASFPLLNTSSGTGFNQAWQSCTSLTSFPLLNTFSGINFAFGWYNCNSLTDFPANMFDTTGTLIATAFTSAWRDCALTAQSIENILVSLDTNGATGITLGINGGTNAAKTTWSTAAVTAYDNLIVKGWTISFNA